MPPVSSEQTEKKCCCPACRRRRRLAGQGRPADRRLVATVCRLPCQIVCPAVLAGRRARPAEALARTTDWHPIRRDSGLEPSRAGGNGEPPGRRGVRCGWLPARMNWSLRPLAREVGATGCFASDGRTNLVGHTKAALLVRHFGEHGFDYVGNERRDLAVWKRARRAIGVNLSARLTQQVKALDQQARFLPRSRRWRI